VVSDYLGRIYNKDSVLEWLISPDGFADGEVLVKHIRSLKDVVELKFSKDSKSGKWTCPVTRKEVGIGSSKFVAHAECGDVFAESAIKEIESEICLECGTKVDKENIIALNASSAKDIDRLQKRMERLAGEGLTHSLKKVGSKKKRKDDEDDKKKNKKLKHKHEQVDGGINNKDALDISRKIMKNVSGNEKSRSNTVRDLYLQA